jgi:hypothetical protein
MNARWEDDERGEGIADGRALIPGVEELTAALRSDGWVAEEPQAHLLPHFEHACELLPFELRSAASADDGTYEVQLHWTGDEAGVGAIRAAVFALVGSFAESATFVRQRCDPLVFEVATGELADAAFAPHGHTLRIAIA